MAETKPDRAAAREVERWHELYLDAHQDWKREVERHQTNLNLLGELIDILARPVQDGGEGMADCVNSPLSKLKAKVDAVRGKK